MKQERKIQTISKKIFMDLRKVKLEFLAAHLFHKQAKAARPLFAREGENYWRQQDLISVAEIGLAAIKGLLTHTFIML